MAIQETAAKWSTIGLRFVSYFFLRWGLLPPLVPVAFTLFAIYLPSFVSSYLTALQNDVSGGGAAEEAEVLVTETAVNGTTDDDGRLVVEEVEVKEEAVLLGTKPPAASPLSTLLTGLPNPRSLVLSLLTLLLNVACVSMVADRVYSEHAITADDLSFVRLGYVSDKEAKLLVREPDQAKMPVTIDVRLKDPQPPFDTTIWQTVGGVRWTNNETDYTAVVTVPALHSEPRTYVWKSSNGHHGEFTSAPAPGRYPADGQFTFLSTSCIVNRLPYNPLDHPLAIPGMRHLADLLSAAALGAPQFMLFLGDFVYADVPRWWGQAVADYRQKYRAVYASPEWPRVGQNLSWIHVLDDHEIQNDWDNGTVGVYEAAVDPWRHYHTAVNPPVFKKPGAVAPRSEAATWFAFTQGPASFFMLDTRSYRSNNKVPYADPDKTMLGAEQRADLLAYLARPEPKGVQWKIIASSVPFTKNWPVNTQDTWGGFLAERGVVLEAMWDAAARGVGVVVLSGDRHEFAATKFPPPPGSRWDENATVYEFSASPLSQFYSPVPTYRQTDNEDVQIKYINKGYSKFGAISIEKADPDKSRLSYRLFVDGVEAWNTTLLSPEKSTTGLPGGGRSGSSVVGGFWERFTGSR